MSNFKRTTFGRMDTSFLNKCNVIGRHLSGVLDFFDGNQQFLDQEMYRGIGKAHDAL